jgi:hypothetical protein
MGFFEAEAIMQVKAIGLVEVQAYLLKRQIGIPKATAKVLANDTKLRDVAIRSFEASVYQAYSNSEGNSPDRTFASIDSVEADSPTANEANIFIAKTSDNMAKQKPSDVTYARFFLPDSPNANSTNSFIPISAKPERDFLGEWKKDFEDLIPKELSDALDAELALK